MAREAIKLPLELETALKTGRLEFLRLLRAKPVEARTREDWEQLIDYVEEASRLLIEQRRGMAILRRRFNDDLADNLEGVTRLCREIGETLDEMGAAG